MRNSFFKVFTLLSLLIILSSSSCDLEPPKETSDSKQSAQTEQALSNATSEIGMPAIINYTELKNFKWILELRDQSNLITHTYLMNEMTGELGAYLGKSIGFGIPAATQFTNPEKLKIARGDFGQYASEDTYTLPQADPNGLYMPTSTDATWVILIDPKGKPQPQYIEAKINVFTFKIK
jgi:hypothetical protein